jgi:uncharacterized membrane protein YraQ (UPF0718 family)
MRNFASYVIVEGALLFGLFYGMTLLLAFAQQYSGMQQLMEKLRRARLGMGNVYAAMIGAPVPFCACSTIPVLSGMLRMGIAFGICITFLMASPLVNEGVVIVMGRYFGLSKTALFVALGMFFPIVAGIALDLLGFGQFVRARIEEAIPGEVLGGVGGKGGISWVARLRFANLAALNEVRSIAPYLSIGLIMGGLIHGFVPQDWIIRVTQRVPTVALVPIMTIVGAPLSFNLAAVVPVAFALTEKKLPFGPILSFLVAGGALSIPEVFLLSKLFRPQLVTAYVVSVLVVAMAMGYVFSWIL